MPADSFWLRIFLVAVAGATGALARWGTNAAVHTIIASRVPWQLGTLVVNVLGCFAFGILVSALRPQSATALTLLTGFLGAYTTFSTFAYDTHQLYVAAGPISAALNVALHIGLGMVALVLGMVAGRLLL